MFVPSRLTAARKRRGETITSLNDLSGISTKSISDYENCKREPSEDTLIRLGKALRVPSAYFARPPLDDVPDEAVSFRARTKMPMRSKDMALTIASHAVELRAWIDSHYQTPSVDVPTLHKYSGTKDAALAAEVVRAKWGLGQAPVGNMVHLLELHGVAVFSVKPPQQKGVLDAFSFRVSGRPFVLLNTAKSAERGRFDAAHELGHLVLHGEAATGPDAEREADAFASSFLMPTSDVRAHARMNMPVSEIIRKKLRWRVAAIALAYRLHDLDLLTDWLYHTTCVDLSRMGYRSGEPRGVERESSRLLSQVMADLLTTSGGFRALCNALGVSPHDINDLVFELAPLVLAGDGRQSPPNPPDLKVIPGGKGVDVSGQPRR